MSDDYNRPVDLLQCFKRRPRALLIAGRWVVERQIGRDGVMPACSQTLHKR